MTIRQLVRHRLLLPKRVPTLEQVGELLNSTDFQELTTAVYRLKEYRVGLRIVERLITFVQRNPLLDVQNAVHQRLLTRLWRSKLRFLDLADEWDEYLEAVQALRGRPELLDTTGPTLIEENTYKNYKNILSRRGVERGLRLLLEDVLARVEASEEGIYDEHRRWSVRLPPHSKHILENWDMKDRMQVVQRKVDLRDSGKRVDYLRHKQTWDLTDEEYASRIEWLKAWRAYCARCR